MCQPLVSIITPCYNGENYLDRYFNSILNQTYPNLELIFINDGSADRTEEIVESYRPNLEQRGIAFTYLSQENAGQAAALNRGLKLFAGDYLTWPDADDEMTPDCIEKKVQYLEEHPEISLCICRGLSVMDNEHREIVGTLERNPPEGKETLFEDLLFVHNVFFVPGGYMIRTSRLDDTIPGRDIYSGRGGQNAQILLPVCYNQTVGYLDDCLFTYYIRSNSHSHQINDSIRTIDQLEKYEIILIQTLGRMQPEVLSFYQAKIHEYYSRLEFGNAIDSRNVDVIKKQFLKLRQYQTPSLMEQLLYMKHTWKNKK